ncbi:MAG: glycosyltransferase family 4 protein [Planctomycetota bacterium]|nr:glycosyltransferase family 4 protein [Planctomycetota bacterium]
MKGLSACFSVAPWPTRPWSPEWWKSRGGPAVMMARFVEAARRRGYSVRPFALTPARQPCLLNITCRGLEAIFDGRRRVVYRVAGMFLRGHYERVGKAFGDREYRPEYDRINGEIRECLRKADFVIYQSRWSKRNLDTLHVRPEGSWEIIPNAVDLEEFSPAPETPPVAGGRPVIGTSGVLRGRPRLEVLFDVASRLPVRPRILILGRMDGHCRRVYEKAVSDPAWRDLVRWAGPVAPDSLPRYYRMMDCLVHTVAGDACPNVVVEALACGVPVVCPEEGGTAELVGPAGVAVPDPEGMYGEALREGMAEGVKRVLANLGEYRCLARRQAENNNDMAVLTSRYLAALGLPPSAPGSDRRSRVLRPIGAVLRAATPRIGRAGGDRPKIALTLWDWKVGGIASWMFRLAEALPGFEFHFVALTIPEHHMLCEKVGRFACAPGFFQLRRLLRDERIPLVQLNSVPWSVHAAFAAGVPKVIERTDGILSCCSMPKDRLDLVIASTAGTVPFMRRFWPDIPYEVIYNSLDIERADAAPTIRDEPPGTVVVGVCSRFGRGKRLDFLIEAVGRLARKGLPVRLLLAGEDSRLPGARPMEKELRRLAAGFGDAVKFIGPVDDPIPVTKGFDIGACSSMNEGIPNSLIEPMACGKPVVSTRVGDVEELVEDGVNGFLVPPGDAEALAGALEKLVLDPDLRGKMGAAARRTIETKFSFRTAVERYRAIYEKLTAI